MASGFATRYGSNKLLADLGGRPVIEHVIDSVKIFAGASSREVILLTRWPEVAEISRASGIRYCLHSYSAKSEVIQLGISCAEEAGWDSCMFFLGDQPLLRPESILRLHRVQITSGTSAKVYRLGWDSIPGSPVIFSRCHYAPLMSLTGESGGMSVFGIGDTEVIPAGSPEEMLDIDTPDDMEIIRKIYNSNK